MQFDIQLTLMGCWSEAPLLPPYATTLPISQTMATSATPALAPGRYPLLLRLPPFPFPAWKAF